MPRFTTANSNEGNPDCVALMIWSDESGRNPQDGSLLPRALALHRSALQEVTTANLASGVVTT